MRIVFFGTPAFAGHILLYLLKEKANIVAVVTRPDKPRGRSGRNLPSPVKIAAEAHSIPILQPEKASTDEVVQSLALLSPDLFVVVAYGEILKNVILSIPKRGSINVHASLLPKYRGAAPIQRCLMSGEKETGVTIIEVAAQMDAGDMLGIAKMEIPQEMTAGELENALCELACSLLIDVIKKIENGAVQKMRQNSAQVTFAPKITPADRPIDWKRSAIEIHNQIRALSPEPGAYTHIQIGNERKQLTIKKSQPLPDFQGSPGMTIPHQVKWIIGCGSGALALLEVQLEGKKAMRAQEFIRGMQSKSFTIV